MSEKHVILLANFYGSYLNKSRFRASTIVNNAGIEQLASLGVEKVHEVKSQSAANADIYVLLVAGLTDVLIKSVEEGKNKLEITPNSSQLIETKMSWAQTMLQDAGAKVIWVVMPPISLRMYHTSEGWNVNKVPGMSNGLDREQRVLNQLMLDYRLLCLKFNRKDAKKIMNGPFFTDMVVEYSTDKTSMHLNTSLFESDGISPTTKLVDNWSGQIEKIFSLLDKKIQDKSSRSFNQPGSGDNWNLPAPRERRPFGDQNDRGVKRGFGDHNPGTTARSLVAPRRDEMSSYDGDRRDYREREYNQQDKRARNYSPTRTNSNIPSLLNLGDSRVPSRRSSDYVPANNFSGGKPSGHTNDQMANAVQLLAATMQLSGGNSANVNTVFNALIAQQQQEQREAAEKKRKEEEARLAIQRKYEEDKLRQSVEETRRREAIKRAEEAKRLEEIRRREDERRRQQERIREEERQLVEMRRREEEERRLKIEAERRLKEMEENRLREVQIAAKLAMEQQRIRLEQRQRQAEMTLMAVTRKVQEQMLPNASAAIPSLLNMSSAKSTTPAAPAHSALDRINEKLRSDREKRVPDKKPEAFNVTKNRTFHDPEWKKPLVLFSFLNRTSERKPLRGICGFRIGKGASKALSDTRSRGVVSYKQSSSSIPSVNFLKLQVKRPGEMTPFEVKIANFNNRVLDMLEECDALIFEGRLDHLTVRREGSDTVAPEKAGERPAVVPKKDGLRNGSSSDNKPLKIDSDKETSSTSSAINAPSNNISDKAVRPSAAARVGTANKHSSPVADLRETLNKSQTRSSEYATVRSKGSVDSKPRWDQSDESEDELLWDDDEPSSLKPAEDEDDVKSIKEDPQQAQCNDTVEELAEAKHVKDKVYSSTLKHARSSARRNSATSVDAAVKKTVDSKTESGSVGLKDDFVTLDDFVDQNVDNAEEDQTADKAEPHRDNFVTIDET